MSVVLAIDPGLHCGFAVGENATRPLQSGMWLLDRGPYGRWLNLWSALDRIEESHHVDRVAHQLVERHPTPGRPGLTNIYAAHCYGAIVAVLEMWAEHHHAKVLTVPVATLKKHATGKGNAPKEAMMAAAAARWPEERIGSTDQADALWLLDYALRTTAGEGALELIRGADV